MFQNRITFDSFIRTLSGLILFVGILVFVNYLSGVLLPFFLAWLIAYLIYPIVKLFQYKLGLKNRMLSILCTLLLLLLLGVTVFYLLVPPLLQEFAKVKDLLAEYFTSGVRNSGTNIPHTLTDFLRENVDINALNQVFNPENLSQLIKGLLPRLWAFLSGSISFLFSVFAFFIVLLYIVFILLDYEAISQGWSRFIPERYRSFAENLVSDVEYGMNRYFRGQALVALIVGILFSIGFLIIDFPLAIGLGLFIGALNLVPYLQIIGFVPTIMLAILKAVDTGQNFWLIMLAAVIVFAVVQIIQDGFLVPKIMGKITGLNPAIILLSLSVWGYMMGMVGMIIALPMTTLMISYYQRFVLNHERIFPEEPKRPAKQPKKDKKK